MRPGYEGTLVMKYIFSHYYSTSFYKAGFYFDEM